MRRRGRVQARDNPGARSDAGERKRHALAKHFALIVEHRVNLRLRRRRKGGLFAGRLDEEEAHVAGRCAPFELKCGALGEVCDGVAHKNRHPCEARALVARALDEDAARRRARLTAVPEVSLCERRHCASGGRRSALA